jgi:hypothetical protein
MVPGVLGDKKWSLGDEKLDMLPIVTIREAMMII